MIQYNETDYILATAMSYQGYDEFIKEIIDDFEEQREDNKRADIVRNLNIIQPAYDKERYDSFKEMFWMLLVLSYGDYGTSPCYGWIEHDNYDDAINYLKYLLKGDYMDVYDPPEPNLDDLNRSLDS